MRRLITPVILLLLLASCAKKDRIITISGNVYDPALKKNIEGAEIKVKAAKVQGGVYNPSYVEIASTRSDPSGNYSVDVKVEKFAGYRFAVSKDQYFDVEKDAGTEEVEAGSTYKADFNIYPVAEINLKVKNTQPQGNDDEIKYRFKNIEAACHSCCNNTTVTGTGPTYSADKTCEVRGEKNIIIEWVVSKKGNQHLYSDTIYTPAFKTTTYKIDY